MLEHIDRQPRTREMRRNAILRAAAHHFADYGFRGASLREISKDAAVSLTLLDHHFGTKRELMDAVVKFHGPTMKKRLCMLSSMIAPQKPECTVAGMVEAWVQAGFDTADQPDGDVLLRLLARGMDNPDEEGMSLVRDELDDGAELFIDGLITCFPGASRHAAACGFLCINAAVSQYLIAAPRLFRSLMAGVEDGGGLTDQERLVRFLTTGLDATLAH
ncbi:MAG: TetR family transcriptional regulator [Burkholderiaceae bacterium]|jgi:AcrR family transcriptional regulator